MSEMINLKFLDKKFINMFLISVKVDIVEILDLEWKEKDKLEVRETIYIGKE